MQSALLNRARGAAFKATRPNGCSRSVVVVRATAEAPVVERKERKLGPLERGGTLSGDQAAGKDAGDKARAMATGVTAAATILQIVDGRFVDDRWIGGRWDLNQFKNAAGEVDWDKVIDAEVARRKLLEDYPIPSINEDPVNFDTSEIPWWAWVKRFHLPEAEKLNGRAAMMGYVLALFVDSLTGAGLLEQQESFLGKLALHICVFAILLVRSSADLDKYKGLIDEATFYDKQWNATWDGVKRPSEAESQ
ncbi:hypothetical protein PLESTB_001772400 [Pleodorina starrii]|uniref:Uncharacterized protein n=1 Tax=Pleodorina starrii TaxID=330485 RepID=A0A9W6C1U6_9CHLO|nr:hypothetical protein PLESTM_000825800 [Pleodorina starrii]GLC61581.1 hypothetical protein PLESTB_001772400 [Pleodorina starrii]GLC76977.1 hypothetical protein PLESTF_001862900 [Pleodorina starrii]